MQTHRRSFVTYANATPGIVPSLTPAPLQGAGLSYLSVQTGRRCCTQAFTFKAEGLPSNVHVLHHKNECYDWGTLGWALASGAVPQEKYAKFVLLNSSVRGPFVPPYVPVRHSHSVPGALWQLLWDLRPHAACCCAVTWPSGLAFTLLVYARRRDWPQPVAVCCCQGLCAQSDGMVYRQLERQGISAVQDLM